MRRLAVVALALAAASGCGGSAKKQADDPGRAVLGAFLHAAQEGNLVLMRGLTSSQSDPRLSNPELRRLARRLRPLARRYKLLVSERITDQFGLAAVTGPAGVYAAALRRVGDGWRLELEGPVHISPLGPDPGARERRVRQIAAGVQGAGGGGEALLYLDGLALTNAKVYEFQSKLSVVANLPSSVPAGRHSVVAFAGRGENASALAWTFVVPA